MVSPTTKVWDLGCDLGFFVNCIKNNRIDLLKDYGCKCIEVLFMINNSFMNTCITVSVVRGNAYGGGFECALASDYIIAEEQVKFSFPEILFVTFPGMGVYSFVTRRIGYCEA